MSENEGKPTPPPNPHTFSQEIQIANLSARVPEKVARGAFATGVLVLQANQEFVLDFFLRMNQPHQISARVILPVSLIPNLIEVLKANLENYKKTFGYAPQALPMPNPPPVPPTIDEIYRDLKIADETLMGAYANSVMVVHNASEFCLEFISNFYPKAIITSRVYLSAPQVPVMVNTLTQSWSNYQAKQQQLRQQQGGPPT
jgi:Protein of unknown function (DUF3467)